MREISHVKTLLKYFFLFIAAISLSCSSDTQRSSIDTTLLYGQWYDSDLCSTQNSLLLNSDNSYIRIYSGNSCSNNENHTIQYSGTYSINGDIITFDEQSSVIIEEGSSGAPPVPTFNTLIYSKITEIDDNTLIIERKFNVDGQDYFLYWDLYKN